MAIPGTVTLTGPIAPTSTVDKYPVFDAFYGLDGLRNISGDTTALNTIPFERRRQGMIVGINSTTGTTYWKLNPPTPVWLSATTDWSSFQSGGSSKYSGVFSFSGSVQQTITHGLNTQDLLVQMWDSANKLLNGADIIADTVNTVQITVATSGNYRVVIIG
jgi:hypothetical protein